jgi:hypothetical protein
MQKQSSSNVRKTNVHQQSQDNLNESHLSTALTQNKDTTYSNPNAVTALANSSNESMLYETKRISLRLCYVFRRSASIQDVLVLPSANGNISYSSPPSTAAPPLNNGTNASVLDIVLPYAQTCYSVRFLDDGQAKKWFHTIHSKISRCLLEILPEIEEHFYVARNATEVKALGWLTEQVRQEESLSSSSKPWKPVFLVLTDAEICFLCCAPVSRQTCREPDLVYPILSTRSELETRIADVIVCALDWCNLIAMSTLTSTFRCCRCVLERNSVSFRTTFAWKPNST